MISKKDGEYYIRFATDILSRTKIYFVLKCNYEEITEILNRLNKNLETYYDIMMFGFLSDYVVVAQIDDIKKTTLQITGYSEGEEEVSLEYVPADTFIATGKCIDLSYIGED